MWFSRLIKGKDNSGERKINVVLIILSNKYLEIEKILLNNI